MKKLKVINEILDSLVHFEGNDNVTITMTRGTRDLLVKEFEYLKKEFDNIKTKEELIKMYQFFVDNAFKYGDFKHKMKHPIYQDAQDVMIDIWSKIENLKQKDKLECNTNVLQKEE